MNAAIYTASISVYYLGGLLIWHSINCGYTKTDSFSVTISSRLSHRKMHKVHYVLQGIL